MCTSRCCTRNKEQNDLVQRFVTANGTVASENQIPAYCFKIFKARMKGGMLLLTCSPLLRIRVSPVTHAGSPGLLLMSLGSMLDQTWDGWW